MAVEWNNYSGREAPSLGFGSGSSCSRRTCQRMRARMPLCELSTRKDIMG